MPPAQDLPAAALAVFEGALAACDARMLTARATAGLQWPRLRVVALGKAAMAMARGLADSGREIVAGLLMTSLDYVEADGATGVAALESVSLPGRWHVALGEHPVPGMGSFAAAVELRAFLARAERDPVLFLLSGGGSALVEAPLTPWFHNRDLMEWNRIAAGSAWPIAAVNAVRKHMSAIKGGRLLGWLPDPTRAETWVLSDVPAGRPDLVASGPTMPDPSTKSLCAGFMARELSDHPHGRAWQALFEGADLPETPKPRADGHLVHPVRVLADNRRFCEAAAAEARQRGFAVTELGADWESEDRDRYLAHWRDWLAEEGSGPRAAIGGGEVASERSGAGIGGRSLDFGLRLLPIVGRSARPFALLSVASDGRDGSAPSCGALFTAEHAERWSAERDEVMDALERTSSTYDVAARWGAALPARPTGNNLRDLHLVLLG